MSECVDMIARGLVTQTSCPSHRHMLSRHTHMQSVSHTHVLSVPPPSPSSAPRPSACPPEGSACPGHTPVQTQQSQIISKCVIFGSGSLFSSLCYACRLCLPWAAVRQVEGSMHVPFCCGVGCVPCAGTTRTHSTLFGCSALFVRVLALPC